MAKILLSLAAGIMAGVAVTMLTRPADPAGTSEPDAAGLGSRVAALETALANERRARLALEATVAAFGRSADGFRSAPDGSAADAGADGCADPAGNAPGAAECMRDDAAVAAVADDPGAVSGPGDSFGPGSFRRRGDQRDLGERLVDAGFTPERSAYVVDRVESLRLDMLQARYEARRTGDSSGLRARESVDDVLRAELGDSDYERYLTALGRPADVAIADVLANSPAAAAGFEPGDRIVGYGGERIFDMNQLTDLTFEGQAGETVAVDVIRDGQTIQLYLPRGPLGISGGRGFGRPR